MKKQNKKKKNKHYEIIQIVLSLIAIAVSLFDIIGKPARLAIVLTLMSGSIGLGVSIGIYAERRRRNAEAAKKNITAVPAE